MSPKTERYLGGEMRYIPLFPEMRAVLMEAFEQGEERGEYVITRCRDCNVNLRTQFERIIARIGVKQWPRLFHNLRATRQIEEPFPSHGVCRGLGNSERVARIHCLQLRDDHFERACADPGDAAQNRAQQAAACHCTASATTTPRNDESPGFAGGSCRVRPGAEYRDDPDGIRTRVAALKGPCPRPLDDRAIVRVPGRRRGASGA